MANNYDIPLNNSPTWPSLYWPFDNANYLYQANDIWRFTTIWTLIFFTSIYGFAGLWTWIVFRKYRWSFLIPIGFVIIALLTGFINSVIIGYILAGAYNIGELPMSVWIPFLWGLIQAFLLLI
ncbi:hypothetical protein C2G38_2008475, partial [Gigaspora rosea]